MRQIHVHLLPELVESDHLRGATCVVIDVLRATTTIAYALAAGAEAVIPCLEVEQALQLAGGAAERPLLGGERSGVRIEGFDFANSPSEYSPERVAGRIIAFTTTNGTKAMERARQAQRVLLGAFVNLSSLTAMLHDADNVQILCAGTKNQITREDVVLAGVVVDRLLSCEARDYNDSARIARVAWLEVARAAAAPTELSRVLAIELRDTQGGRNLIRLGLEADLLDAAAIDRFDFTPEFDVSAWRIGKA